MKKLNEECNDSNAFGKSCVCGTLMDNIQKNRYKDILPYDVTRVILGRDWDTYMMHVNPDPSIHSTLNNYINASYIGSCSFSVSGAMAPGQSVLDPEFIVTQDPLDNTIGDFWRMVYEQRSSVIVRISGACWDNEDRRMYWNPSINDVGTYASAGGGDYCVQLIFEGESDCWIERRFSVWPMSNFNQAMNVKHFQYKGWPREVLPEPQNLQKFIERVQKGQSPVNGVVGPTIVQCRGGVGRNGVYIAAVLLKRNIEQGMMGVDIYNLVKQLRHYRAGLVNTEGDYLGLYKFAVVVYQNRRPNHATDDLYQQKRETN